IPATIASKKIANVVRRPAEATALNSPFDSAESALHHHSANLITSRGEVHHRREALRVSHRSPKLDSAVRAVVSDLGRVLSVRVRITWHSWLNRRWRWIVFPTTCGEGERHRAD